MLPLVEPYIIDANIFMQAARHYYSFDFAKPFWDGLVKFAEDGRILSLDKVYDEIMRGNDALKKWSEVEFREHFKKSETIPITEHYAELCIWAESEMQYDREAKDVFMKRHEADAWVIAYAKMYNCTVVTSEVYDAKITVSIPIPNVCDAFKIPYCNTYQMIRNLGFAF